MPQPTLGDVHFDCIHFRGGIPCKPNKESGVTCIDCSVYSPISKKILIIKLGALGDVIRTTPLVVKYRSLYPNCHITWLTHSPDVLPTDSINTILKPDAFSLFSIQQSQFDIAINLDKESEACQLLTVVSAVEKYGYSWKDNHISAATPAAEPKLMTGFFDSLSQQNTKNYIEEIFDICHLDYKKEPYLINKNEQLANDWKLKMNHLAGNKQIIGLNTGCGPRWNTRLLPIETWLELARDLAKKGYFPVFLGGALEHEKNQELATQSGAYYPGHFSLEEFIALTDSCELIVTQVSMMMHIATALQKKMVLMNNIFNKHEFELYGRGEIVEPKNGCVCYFGNTCKKGEQSCMHELTVDELTYSVERVLSKI